MQRENKNKCNIKEPHSHLVAGRTFECEKGVKQTMSERFEEAYKKGIFNSDCHPSIPDCIPLTDVSKFISFIKSEIDLALENRNKEVVEILEIELTPPSQWTDCVKTFNKGEEFCAVCGINPKEMKKTLINLITNRDE